MVAAWGEDPAYAQSLEAVMGPGALDTLLAGTEAHAATLTASARVVYDNLMGIAVRAFQS